MSDDEKIFIAKLEQTMEHIVEMVRDQKESLDNSLESINVKNDFFKEEILRNKYFLENQESKIESIKHTALFVQKAVDNLRDDLKNWKDESNDKFDDMKLEVDTLNSKVDSSWLLIFKIISLVLSGALCGAGIMSQGLKSFLGF